MVIISQPIGTYIAYIVKNDTAGGGWDTWVLPDGENYENSYASPTHSKHQLMEDNFSFLRGDGSTEQPYDAFKFKVPWLCSYTAAILLCILTHFYTKKQIF